LPTVGCILGEKLTAFAPHTTGIPFGIGKELEIVKQMYDVACLFDVATDYNDVYETYMATVKSEISYREKNLSYQDALMDTIDSSAYLFLTIQRNAVYILLCCDFSNRTC